MIGMIFDVRIWNSSKVNITRGERFYLPDIAYIKVLIGGYVIEDPEEAENLVIR